jgi:threonine dehydratase
MTSFITLEAIRAAHQRIKGKAVQTPLLPLRGETFFLKAESLQPTGAFKLRGAINFIAGLTEEEKARGVVADSSGNHAQAVAYAARAVGTKATIVMPENAPKIKVEATRYFGAEIIFTGNSTDLLMQKAKELVTEKGFVYIAPFDDLRIIAGTGTIGLEILEDMPDVEAVTVPVSGGGLISGIAAALKLSRPEIKVIGVEPEVAADAKASFEAGEIIAFPPEQMVKTIADGLRVRRVGEVTFPHIKKFVDEIITVSEADILGAVKHIATHARLVAEPSGAVPVAAWLYHKDKLPKTQKNVAVLCGGNLEPALLAQALSS